MGGESRLSDVHPTPEFLAFLNKMQQVQDALFGDGSTQMKAKYSLKPMPEQNVEAVTLNIDGQQSTSTRSMRRPSNSRGPVRGRWSSAFAPAETYRSDPIPGHGRSGAGCTTRIRARRGARWRNGACCGRAEGSRSSRLMRRANRSCCASRSRSFQAGWISSTRTSS